MPQVVKWMSLADNEATPAACNWVYPVIGILEPSPAQVRKSFLIILYWQYCNLPLNNKARNFITVILAPGK